MDSNNKTTTGKPNAAKKFQGHDQKEIKGITLCWGDANAQGYKVFKEHLATLGGSKYVPNMGEDYSTKIGEDPKGQPIYKADPVTKELAEQMHKEELKSKKIFAVAYGQLYEEMKDKLQSNKDYWCIMLKLLKMLWDICYQGSKTKVHPETSNLLLRAFRKLICCQQRSGNLSEYSKHVTDAFKVFKKSLGGSIIFYDKTVTQELKHGSYTILTYADYLGLEDTDPKTTAILTTRVEQSFLLVLEMESHKMRYG
eukprot:jgi/Psemu1/30725/gm1.30725_g